MPRYKKGNVKKTNREEGSSQHQAQRPKKWDKSDVFHYNRMKEVTIPATQLPCPFTMTKLGITDDIQGLFVNMGISGLLSLKELTYPDLVRQFMASAYVTYPADSQHDGFLAFAVEKEYYEVTFNDLCEMFGISAGEMTTGLFWTPELLEFWKVIGTGGYGSPHAKESLIRSPVLRYAVRLIGSLLYGATTSASVSQWELCLLFQGVRHLLPAFGDSTYPPATEFNMGAVLAANLAGYKSKMPKGKKKTCGFGAVVTRILKHVGIEVEQHQVAVNKSNNIEWKYLDMHTLISKEFIAGPVSKIGVTGPYVYVFQDREKRTLYCQLPNTGITALLSEASVEFLPPATEQVERPSYFTPKYKGKSKDSDVEEEEGQAARADSDDDLQPHQLLPLDSSQYTMPDLPPNANSRLQQQYIAEGVKKNNDMLHRMWAAIARIRPCRCQKDDVVHQDSSPTTSGSGSGSSGTHRARKRAKRAEDAGTSGAAGEE